MTQEQKDLLLKDLCARVPYRVKIYLEDFPKATLAGVVDGDIILHCDKYDYTYDTPWDIEYIKPYLFPLSSMTDEQESYLYSHTNFRMDMFGDIIVKKDEFDNYFYTDTDDYSSLIGWLNENHFDYRGLIEKGLAIDATGLNIY